MGTATVVSTLLLTGVAWLLVTVPTGSPAAAQPSSLVHDLVEHATGGADAKAAGNQALERYGWIDRGAGVARIPIEQAIDAVVADPALIAGGPR
ncbi:MAG: hypothetical protein ABJE66_12360 [Deltaproteobacteria bacterium]